MLSMIFGRTFALAALLAAAAPAHADLMTSCAAEVGRYCADVDHGRGRMTACLASRWDELGAQCQSAVQSATRHPLVPGSARRIFDPSFRAALPAVCQPAAARVCPDVPAGDGRVFACLYARSSQVGADCTSEAEQTIRAN